jgi:nucleotide-binding universal stress UspA family protein
MQATDVLVGVDGSRPSRAALRRAAVEAVRRGVALRSVGRWVTTRRRRADIDRKFTAAVDGWRAAHPEVPVERELFTGAASKALIQASAAQPVVVGARGRGGFAGLLLGSVGLHLPQHADCPVLVARRR